MSDTTETPLCVHCWQTEEMHLSFNLRDGRRGCVGERHALTGFTAPNDPSLVPDPPGAMDRVRPRAAHDLNFRGEARAHMNDKNRKKREKQFRDRWRRWVAKKLANIQANNPTRRRWLLSDIAAPPARPEPEHADD